TSLARRLSPGSAAALPPARSARPPQAPSSLRPTHDFVGVLRQSRWRRGRASPAGGLVGSGADAFADSGEQVVFGLVALDQAADQLVVLCRPCLALDLQRHAEPEAIGVDLRGVGA